jgi:hypothetical protein
LILSHNAFVFHKRFVWQDKLGGKTMPMEQTWKERFIADPPDLVGGVELSVQQLAQGLVLHLRHGSASADLRAAFLSVPYPSGLRLLLARDPEIEAVVVERSPRGLDAAAEEAGVSYLDLRGRGRLVAPGFVYVVPPPPSLSAWRSGEDLPPDSERRGSSAGARRVSPFAPKASRLVRALLADVGREWRLSDLAKLVAVDPGNAHRVLGALVETGLIERDDDRYVVSDPGSLLEAWAEATPLPRMRITFELAGDPRQWLGWFLRDGPGRFAISGEMAAELLAPYLPARRILLHCLDSEALDRVRDAEREARELLPSGAARVIAVPAEERVGDFGSTTEGLPLVSPAQLYVDLFRERGQAREAAEHVRRQLLRF